MSNCRLRQNDPAAAAALMYETNFGLKKPLFDKGIAQDAAVFLAPKHDAIIANTKVALSTFDSALVLTGAAGVGKTTLISAALRTTSTRLALGWITAAPANAAELLELLLVEFGFNAHRMSRVERMQMWRQFLNEASATSSRVYVIAERAEDLAPEVLRAADSLTAADASGGLGVNLVLLGQPALADHLKTPVLESLCQRIRLRQRLDPLTEDELRAYLDHHVKLAGGTLEKIFTPGSIRALHDYSGGIPRVVNNLCESALSLAASGKEGTLSPEVVTRVAVGLFGMEPIEAADAPWPSVQVSSANGSGARVATPVASATAIATPAVPTTTPAAPIATPAAATDVSRGPATAPAASTAAAAAPASRVAAPVGATAAGTPAAAAARPTAVPAPVSTSSTVGVTPPPSARAASPPAAGTIAAPPSQPSVAMPQTGAPAPRSPAAPSPAPDVAVDLPADALAALAALDFPVLTDAIEPLESLEPRTRPRAETAYVSSRTQPAAPGAAARQPGPDAAIGAASTAAPSKAPATPAPASMTHPVAAPPPASVATPMQPAAATAQPAVASTQPVAAPAQPVSTGNAESAPAARDPSDADVLRQTQTMRALAAAKTIDDISNSMAETLFSEADLEMLSAALESAGWSDDETIAAESVMPATTAATPSIPAPPASLAAAPTRPAGGTGNAPAAAKPSTVSPAAPQPAVAKTGGATAPPAAQPKAPAPKPAPATTRQSAGAAGSNLAPKPAPAPASATSNPGRPAAGAPGASKPMPPPAQAPAKAATAATAPARQPAARAPSTSVQTAQRPASTAAPARPAQKSVLEEDPFDFLGLGDNVPLELVDDEDSDGGELKKAAHDA
jgi:type II secretory pathway predicted ATPase ExeA